MEILKNISIIFLSIFFESLPFLLLGSLISAVIETFVSNEKISKIIPKNKILGSLVGIVLGFFIPACDCAVIPVSKRLLKKKIPINVVVSFMLASPIINPVVLLSTYYAFYKTTPSIFYYRLILGILVALIIGIIIDMFFKDKDIMVGEYDCESESCHHHDHEIDNDVINKYKKNSFKNIVLSIFKHTTYDLFDVVKYLMLGGMIASLVQILLPRSIIIVFSNNQILSIITLMLFAYLISLCSTSDSFVGKSLLSCFSKNSVVAYLLLGPMIDIKNTFVLLGNYKKSFVITLITLIFAITFLASILAVNII